MDVRVFRGTAPAQRPRRALAALRAPAVLVTAGALVLGLGQSLVFGTEQAAAPPGPGHTDLVSSGVPVAGSPDVSADGRFVAFAADTPAQFAGAQFAGAQFAGAQFAAAQPPTAQFAAAGRGSVGGAGIYVRTLGTELLEQVAAGPAGTRFAAPSISADGRLVAYTIERDPARAAPDPDGAGPTLPDLAVVDRTNRDALITRQITGGAGDLPFQRSLACGTAGGTGADAAAACGPELSADGRTVAFPARLAVPSPRLDLYVLDDGARRDLAAAGRSLPVLALRAGDEPALTTVHVAVTGPDPVTFTVPALNPGGGFALVPDGTTCGVGPGAQSVVRPGFTCTIEVSFDPGRRRCDSLVQFASLDTTGPTAGARTALALVGVDTRGGCRPAGGRASAAPQRCASARAPAGTAIEPEAGGPANALPLGEVEVGADRVVAVPLRATDSSGEQVVELASPGCDVTMVAPRDPPPGETPCETGMRLIPPLLLISARARDLAQATVAVPGAAAGCTAYLRLAPGSVRPHAAALLLRPTGGGAARVIPVAGTGAADVVLLRRDPAGTGNFAAPGAIARVVGVDSAGNPVPAGEPSVSADGRYVAFTSPARGPGRQVHRHDTDARGDGSYRSGSTAVVSFLSNGSGGLPAWAGAPSLSGDGHSVAFLALPRGAAPNRSDPSACACPQVYVRDVDTTRTYPTADAATAGRHSEAPALADDGSTVAFRTRPDRAVPGAVGNVLVRDLAPDRASPRGSRNDAVPLDVAGVDARRPAVDAHGGVVALQAGPASGPEQVGPQGTGPQGNGPEAVGNASRVLVRSRYGSAVTTAGLVDFGRQETGSQSRTQSLTVRNEGPGPLTVSPRANGPFVVRDGCAGVVLHRGESCSVDVSFAPTEVGRSGGSVALTTTSTGGVLEQRVVPVTGLGIRPVLQITPKALALPRAGLGIFGETLAVSVRNTGPEPVAVSASSSTGEFAVRQGCRAQLEPNGAPCVLQLAFRPAELGRRTAALAVRWVPAAARKARAGEEAAGDGRPKALTQMIPMASETLAPTLALSPAVVTRGRVATLSGRHFPPGTLVRVEDLDGALVAAGRADKTGVLQVHLVVFGARPLGPWQLRARIGKALTLPVPSLLIVPGSFQPPDFARRR